MIMKILYSMYHQEESRQEYINSMWNAQGLGQEDTKQPGRGRVRGWASGETGMRTR